MNDEYLDFAKDLAQEAGQIMRKYFRADEIGLKLKDDLSPLTLADTEINSLVIAKVKQQFPDHGVLGEEESYNLDKDNLWIVDPLDGTGNFAKRIPLFAFSIALVTQGEPKLAVVYDPNTQRLLYATAGEGAYENEKKLDIDNESSEEELMISSWVVGGIDNSIFKDKKVHGAIAGAFAEQGNIDTVDFPIAYALALVGSGDFNATVSSIKTPWDVVAGSLIAKEAGAKVTDLFGSSISDWSKEANGILVAAPAVHEELLKILLPVLKDIK
jgi:fructose-1,6-bisphosphatase/inositol monophosphatase family enzyme